MNQVLSATLFLLACSARAFGQGYETSFDEKTDWDWHLTGLWSVDGSPSAAPGGTYRSAPSSLNYNNRLGTFDTGGPNSGEATSPVINVTHLSAPALTFWCNHKTEHVGCKWDRRFVRFLSRNGKMLAEHQLGVSSVPGGCAVAGIWHSHLVPVDPAWGYVKVAFLFDSVDHLYNAYPGWFVDDVRLRSSYAPGKMIQIYETDFNQGASGWSLDGLWKVDGTPWSPYSTSNLNYNDGVDYDTGCANSGSALSPPVELFGNSASLVFWCRYLTDTTGTATDTRWVRILSSNGTVLSSRQLAGVGASPCGPMGSWHSHKMALDANWGTVKIAFEFSSVDADHNGHAGWFLENLEIWTGGTTVPAVTSYATVFENDQDWERTGLWHIDNSPASAPGGSAYTGSTSLNYNNGANFDTGGPNAGTARSPVIDVSYLQAPVVTFKCNYQTETTGTSYDRRILRILSPTGKILAEHLLAGKSSANPCAAMGTWHEHAIDLNPSWSKVRLEFRFDSVDGYYNGGAGWFVDDLFFDLPDIKNHRKEMMADVRIEAGKLRFTTTSANAGFGPLTAAKESFEFEHADGHNHLHFQKFVTYRLVSTTGKVVTGKKTGFCFVNSVRIRKSAPNPYDYPAFGSCRTIVPGWGDRYGSYLAGQELDLSGVPDGDYTLDFVFDPEGKMKESDETNNLGEGVRIRIQGSGVTILPHLNP